MAHIFGQREKYVREVSGGEASWFDQAPANLGWYIHHNLEKLLNKFLSWFAFSLYVADNFGICYFMKISPMAMATLIQVVFAGKK